MSVILSQPLPTLSLSLSLLFFPLPLCFTSKEWVAKVGLFSLGVQLVTTINFRMCGQHYSIRQGTEIIIMTYRMNITMAKKKLTSVRTFIP